MEDKFKEHFNLTVDDIKNDKKKRKNFINNVLDYNNYDDVLNYVRFFDINIKKLKEEFLHDPLIMLSLIKHDINYVLLLKYHIDNFFEIAQYVVSKKGILLDKIFNIVKKCTKEEQRLIILEACKNDGWVMKFPLSKTDWLLDLEISKVCVEHENLSASGNGYYGNKTYQFIHPLEGEDDFLINNFEFMVNAFNYDQQVLGICNKDMQTNAYFIQNAISNNERNIRLINPEYIDENILLFMLRSSYLIGFEILAENSEKIVAKYSPDEKNNIIEKLKDNISNPYFKEEYLRLINKFNI